MPKPIVTLKHVQDSWVIYWWRPGSCLSDKNEHADIQTAEAAARAFAESNRMAYLPLGETFLAIEKRNNVYGLVEIAFEGTPNWLGVAKSSKEKVIAEGDKIAREARKIFLPDFLLG